MFGIERDDRLARQRSQPGNALGATGGTLVDGRLSLRNGPGIGCTVRVATTGALRLRQDIK